MTMRTPPIILLAALLAMLLPAATAAAQNPPPIPQDPRPEVVLVPPPMNLQPAPLPPSTATITTDPMVTGPAMPATMPTNRSLVASVTRVHNSMPEPLYGIGLVTGLSGKGSSERGTRQALLNFIRANGLNFAIGDVIGGSTALVTVTATLPAFAKEGMPLEVKCEVIGDAESLRGGQLLPTPLRAVNGDIYVMASGPVTVAGISASSADGTASVAKNPSRTGYVLDGPSVVRNLESSYYSQSGHLELRLINPSEANARAITAVIRTELDGSEYRVEVVDRTLVRIHVPEAQRNETTAVDLLSRIGQLQTLTENVAKVIIDQTTGVIVAGEGVLITPCVVGLEEITISMASSPEVSQPLPFSNGITTQVPRSTVDVNSRSTDMRAVAGGTTVGELVQNLRTLGLTPAQLVLVFQTLKIGHYLQAELEVH